MLATNRLRVALFSVGTSAIALAMLKREQARINTEVEEAEAQLSREGAKLKKAAEVIQLALNLAESCPDAYLKARPDVRKLWNQAFFWKILVVAGPSAQDEVLYEEPFASLLDSQEDVGSHNSRIVDLRGVEPLTSPVRGVRSTN